ncbi:MAG: NAD-dependent epimerase/dehydratase family protein [Oligoflexales bacterium]|nr:NAD-dependent epimerase/dehydratase family protein [Oligoflexales bacterium]
MSQTNSKKVLIVGPGYLGKHLALELLAEGHEVHTISRSSPGIIGAKHMIGDVRSPFTLKNDYDLVYYLVSAGGYSEAAYLGAYHHGLANALKAVAEFKQTPFFVFASSTSLFVENSGNQVTEDSEISLRSPSKAIADGEALLGASGIPATVLRFSGIYGPGRDRLAVSVANGHAKLRRQESISNRIHQFDAVGALKFVAKVPKPKPLYIISDSNPSPYNEVLQWLHEGLIAKQELEYESPQTVHKRAANKFCSNQLIRQEGYHFQFPSFKEGFSQIINASQQLKGIYNTNE